MDRMIKTIDGDKMIFRGRDSQGMILARELSSAGQDGTHNKDAVHLRRFTDDEIVFWGK